MKTSNFTYTQRLWFVRKSIYIYYSNQLLWPEPAQSCISSVLPETIIVTSANAAATAAAAANQQKDSCAIRCTLIFRTDGEAMEDTLI